MSLEWVFKGVDQISGPARAAAASLAAMRRELTGAQRGADGRFTASWASRLRGQASQLRSEWNASAGAMHSFAMGLAGAGAAAGVAGLALGRSIVELAAFQQSAETTLTNVMGNATDAAQAFREAITIANQTPLDTTDVITAMNGLAAAGFRTLPAMRPMLGIMTDIGALHGSDAMNRFAHALGQVQARGKMTTEQLNMIREAAPSLATPLMDALGSSLHLTGPNIGEQVQAAITAGRVSAEMLNSALGAAGMVMNAHSGEGDTQGALGGIARAQSQTLAGSLSNVSNAWDNLILSMGTGTNSIAQGSGMTSFRHVIDSVTAALDVTTPSGQRAMGVLRPLIDGVFGALFRGNPGTSMIDTIISGIRDLTPGIIAAARGVRDFVDGFGSGFMGAVGPALELIQQLNDDGESGGDTMRSLGQAVGFLAGAFVLGVGVLATAASGIAMIFTELPSDLMALWGSVTSWFSEVPGQLVDGFLGTLHTEWARLIGEVEGLTQMLPDSVRAVLGIHSPSRVFAEIGMYTAAGMAEGVTAGAADVQNAFTAMTAPPAPAGPSSRATGGTPAGVNLTVVIEGRGQSDDDLVDAFRATVEDLFADVFERAALTVG